MIPSFQTIVFPPNVVFADSYINDVRFDLRPSVTASGKGVAYITDSSQEGRNGIVIVDLGTGNSWRHLDGTKYVRPETGFLPVIWGEVVYSLPNGPTQPISQSTFGADGIALSADGATLYFSAVGTRYLYSVPTVPPPRQQHNFRTNGRTIRPLPRPKRHLRRPRNRHQ